MDLEPIILGCATLTLVLVGFGVIFMVSCAPVLAAVVTRDFAAFYLQEKTQQLQYLAFVGVVQWVHFKLLWFSPPYLTFVRASIYPIRKLIMPLVMFIVRLEFRKERGPALYLDLEPVRASGGKEQGSNDWLELLMNSFRPSVRARYRKLEKLFREKQISCRAKRSELHLNLSEVVPVMVEHESRCCAKDGKSTAEEFVKRFLVVVMTTNATLDYYYDKCGKLSSVQLSIQHGQVLHWFMYFCTNQASHSGIWYHGILSAMVRGMRTSSVRYINAQGHQVDSKLHAGFNAAAYTDGKVLGALYPWAFTSDIPSSSLLPILWIPSGNPSESMMET